MTRPISSLNHHFSLISVKVDREKQLVILDETYDDISIDDLREELPGHQPRYVVYSYRMEHDDKRVSFPICFIFYTPRDSQVHLVQRLLIDE